MIKSELASVSMVIRVNFNPSWSTLQIIQDLAEKHHATLIGGSAESGQVFYQVTGFSIGEFRKACEVFGVETHFQQ